MIFIDLESDLTGFLEDADNRKTWNEQKKLRAAFKRAYPKASLGKLSMKNYVQGFGSGNKSFCYHVEWGTKILGHIQGSTVSKFGVWYDKDAGKYDFAQKYGVTLDKAFGCVKRELKALIEAGEAHDLEAIRANKLSPMFKGKILFLYLPDQYLNIFSGRHLHHFLDNLGLQPERKEEIYLQDRIMQLKASAPLLAGLTTEQFSDFLYKQFDPPPKEKVTVLAENQVEADFIDELPPGSSASNEVFAAGKGNGNPNYGKRARALKAIGNLGEEIVLKKERQGLKDAGIHKRVKHVALTNDSKGYDILSYEDDGVTPRHIEVKATVAKNLSRGFYLTENERQKSCELPNYYLYVVFDVKGKNPRIWRKKAPFEDGFFELRPRQYHVFLGTE